MRRRTKLNSPSGLKLLRAHDMALTPQVISVEPITAQSVGGEAHFDARNCCLSPARNHCEVTDVPRAVDPAVFRPAQSGAEFREAAGCVRLQSPGATITFVREGETLADNNL